MDVREAEKCTDLVAIGGRSLAQLLNLTVELNIEFSAAITVSDVASAMSAHKLTELKDGLAGWKFEPRIHMIAYLYGISQ